MKRASSSRPGSSEYGPAADITMSVNVSPRQLYSGDLEAIVEEAIRSAAISSPASLILEVTETSVMDDMDSAIRILGRLKALGVALAIDDFGVGASSLARLRRLPVAVVKIDKSLVDHVPDGHVASALLDAVVGIVRALQLRTIIEGVERADQAEHLRVAGYDLAQGLSLCTADGGRGHRACTSCRPGRRRREGGVPGRSIIKLRRRTSGPDALWSWTTTSSWGRPPAGSSSGTACALCSCRPSAKRWRSCPTSTDVMVVDIGLPDGDGWDLITHVRIGTVHAHMPMVVMTGFARQRGRPQPRL